MSYKAYLPTEEDAAFIGPRLTGNQMLCLSYGGSLAEMSKAREAAAKRRPDEFIAYPAGNIHIAKEYL